MRSWLRGILHPERFHGHGRKRGPFFEGWYFKLVDGAEAERWAVIPGIFHGEDPSTSHAFVQLLDGSRGRSRYYRYPLHAFRAQEDCFEVEIGGSHFSAEGIHLDLEAEDLDPAPKAPSTQAGAGRVEGDLRFGEFEAWPTRWRAPGAMGWYAWVPTLECYHGVLSLDHGLHGGLSVDGRSFGFDGGRGYCEKDWGQGFPSAYIWLQTNHFAAPGSCLSASIAMIPWRRHSFRGFIVGLYHEGTLHRFATYTGARVEKLAVDDKHVDWVLADGDERLVIRAERAEGGMLHAPVRTEMHRRVDETLRAAAEVRLETRGGQRLFEGRGTSAGLEVHGELGRLLAAS